MLPSTAALKGAARAEGDSDVPEKAVGPTGGPTAPRGPRQSGGWTELAGPRDGARPGDIPVERRRRGQAQPHRHARAGQGVEGSSRCLRAPGCQAPRLAARLQRLQQAPLPLPDAVPLRVLRGPRPAVADGELSAARRGAPHGGGVRESIAAKIRADLACGLSPAQIADARSSEFRGRPSTIYRWIERATPACPIRTCAARWVQQGRGGGGARADAARPGAPLLGVLGAPGGRARGRLRDGHGGIKRAADRQCGSSRSTCAAAARSCACFAREVVERAVAAAPRRAGGGQAGRGRSSACFGLILTDNGAEFSTGSPGEVVPAGQGARCRVYYRDVRQSQQKGAASNHVELRKLRPPLHVMLKLPSTLVHPAKRRCRLAPSRGLLMRSACAAVGAPGCLRRRRCRAHGRAGRRGGALRRAAARRRGRQPRPAGEGVDPLI